MAPIDIFLWGVCPYIAFTLLIAVTAIRRVHFSRTWTSKSSEFLEKKQERVATPLFHAALLFVLFGHLGGFVVPKSVTDAMGLTEHMYHVVAFGMGGLFGILLFIGLMLLIKRRFGGDKRMKRNTSTSDKVMYVALTLTIIAGCLCTFTNADGSYVYRETIMPWIRGVLAFQPDPSLVVDAPWPFKFHMIMWMVFFSILPFTRIVHMFSGVTAPIKYAKRKAILYRSRLETEPQDQA